MVQRPRLLGEQLVAQGVLDRESLDHALTRARSGERIGEVLVDTGAVGHDDVARALANQLGLTVAPSTLEPAAGIWEIVPEAFARSRNLVPLHFDDRRLLVAMSDPLDVQSIADVRFMSGRRVDVAVSHTSSIEAAFDSITSDAAKADSGTDTPPPPSRSRMKVVDLVDRLLRTAIDRGASDIHIEEDTTGVQARARIDGRLTPLMEIPDSAHRIALSRIKVIGEMDIADRRRAQDGRVRFDHGERTLSLRISTLPVIGGEKAVVRILDADTAPASLDSLGLSASDLTRLRAVLVRGEGVVLAAGPTGSGKSTTLFAALSELDRVEQNVVTIEDPVEYRLAGTSQVQVDARAGLGFAEALRSVLRQDPDVVMVGEIRDRETAEIAMAAAVTGHLVLSTIHASDAPAAVTRLLHMGVPAHLVSGGLAGVVAQRLVRKLHRPCRGHGCESCADGLSGRTGIYQVLTMSDEMRDVVARGDPTSTLRRLAREGGMKMLSADARRAVAEELTTPHAVASLMVGDETTGTPCTHCRERVPFGSTGCPWCGVSNGSSCVCGAPLEPGWTYCPRCLRRRSI